MSKETENMTHWRNVESFDKRVARSNCSTRRFTIAVKDYRVDVTFVSIHESIGTINHGYLGASWRLLRTNQRHVAITELRHKLASQPRQPGSQDKNPSHLASHRFLPCALGTVPFHAIHKGQVLFTRRHDRPSGYQRDPYRFFLWHIPLDESLLVRSSFSFVSVNGILCSSIFLDANGIPCSSI